VSVVYEYDLGLDNLKETHIDISKDDSLDSIEGKEKSEILGVVRQIVTKWVEDDFETKWGKAMLWQLREKKEKLIQDKKNADRNISAIDKRIEDIKNKRSRYGNWA